MHSVSFLKPSMIGMHQRVSSEGIPAAKDSVELGDVMASSLHHCGA
jgi:hypothetical protein